MGPGHVVIIFVRQIRRRLSRFPEVLLPPTYLECVKVTGFAQPRIRSVAQHAIPCPRDSEQVLRRFVTLFTAKQTAAPEVYASRAGRARARQGIIFGADLQTGNQGRLVGISIAVGVGGDEEPEECGRFLALAGNAMEVGGKRIGGLFSNVERLAVEETGGWAPASHGDGSWDPALKRDTAGEDGWR